MSRGTVDRPDAAFSVVDGYGVSVLVPIVSLVFASAALGDAAEDGTLVAGVEHDPLHPGARPLFDGDGGRAGRFLQLTGSHT